MTHPKETPMTRPDGYAPHTRRSPLTDPWEPLFAKVESDAVCLAVEVREAHCNARGFAHGGLISALADIARGREGGETASAVTVTLTVDFVDSAKQGEWMEVRPSVLKVGRTLAFVDARIVCGERVIARASASFRMV
jgi:uncharacterized protein (TIGR00369 family)